MPNIMICMPFVRCCDESASHLTSTPTHVPSNEAAELEAEIWKRTKDCLFVDDMVVTQCDMLCRDRNGELQPFIRICSTNRDETEGLTGLLRGLADIEAADLLLFAPKDTSKPIARNTAVYGDA